MTHKPSDEMNLQEIADQQVIYWRHKAKKAEAEADRLREALIYIGYSAVGLHPGDPEAMRKIARAALTAEDGDE